MARFKSAGLSDAGRKRENNEDRWHADPDRGIFFVIDGVGGQAAGEKAAETAYQLLRARLERQTGAVEERIREAITVANNEIHRLARSNDDWHGMACVLTVGVIEDDLLTVGHVGDSRLYQIQSGEIRKLTHDHSPVGEREDRGEINERAAMSHPRRNEVYRDVGSEQHTPDDPAFIELITVPFTGSSALLLCTDGLSDLVTSAQILRIVESHAGKPSRAVRALVEAANDAGGKDNITAVLVEGSRFAPSLQASERVIDLPARPSERPAPLLLRPPAFFLYGLLASLLILAALKPHWRDTPDGEVVAFGAIREPRLWRISDNLTAALGNAQQGDTIVLAPGTYHEPIRLKEGVRIVSERPRQAIIKASGIAVQADDIQTGRLEGVRVVAGDDSPLLVGIQLGDSAVEIVDSEVTGATVAGIELLGDSRSDIRANLISGNSGAGIIIRDMARPRLVHNIIIDNGKVRENPKAGIEIVSATQPVMMGNVVRSNGAEPVWLPADLSADDVLRQNYVGISDPPKKPKYRTIVR
jgi:parallel beta-helix repeat protein